MDWLDGGEDLLTAQREFDPIFGYFKRNARFLGLIRLKFRVEDGRIGVMQGRLAAGPRKTNPNCSSRVPLEASGATADLAINILTE